MPNFIRVLSNEVTVNTSVANSVGNASLVRIVVLGTAAVTLTRYAGGNSQQNTTITLLANSENYIQKAPTDTLLSNAAAGVFASNCKVLSG